MAYYVPLGVLLFSLSVCHKRAFLLIKLWIKIFINAERCIKDIFILKYFVRLFTIIIFRSSYRFILLVFLFLSSFSSSRPASSKFSTSHDRSSRHIAEINYDLAKSGWRMTRRGRSAYFVAYRDASQ